MLLWQPHWRCIPLRREMFFRRLLTTAITRLGPAWKTNDPEYYLVEDGRLKLLNGGTQAPISVKLEKPATGPVEVAFELSSDKASIDGHWIMISIADSESGAGYSISACNLETMFGAGTNTSGFAWGTQGEVTKPGLPGAALHKGTDAQELTVKFDPETQKITVERDGEVMLEEFGGEILNQIDQIDFRVSSYPNGPARFIDNIRITQREAE